jgi:hypothetical protein
MLSGSRASGLSTRALLTTKLVQPGLWRDVAPTFQAAKVSSDRDGDELDGADREALEQWLGWLKNGEAALGSWPTGRMPSRPGLPRLPKPTDTPNN